MNVETSLALRAWTWRPLKTNHGSYPPAEPWYAETRGASYRIGWPSFKKEAADGISVEVGGRAHGCKSFHGMDLCVKTPEIKKDV